MRTGAAESDVRIRVAQDVERVGVIEDLFVEVGRAVGHHQPLPLLDLDAAQLGVLGGGALERRHRRRPADDLVNGRRRAFLLVQLPLIRIVRERDHSVRDRVAGGLIARHREHDDEEAELVVGELLPVDVGLDQGGDDVVGRVLAPLVGHRHRVHDQFHR